LLYFIPFAYYLFQFYLIATAVAFTDIDFILSDNQVVKLIASSYENALSGLESALKKFEPATISSIQKVQYSAIFTDESSRKMKAIFTKAFFNAIRMKICHLQIIWYVEFPVYKCGKGYTRIIYKTIELVEFNSCDNTADLITKVEIAARNLYGPLYNSHLKFWHFIDNNSVEKFSSEINALNILKHLSCHGYVVFIIIILLILFY
jgi:hypothetical protein